jgi:hypothetical protein
LLLCLSLQAVAQVQCGDLDLDGDVDADDALILRLDLDGEAPLTLDQALSCDVISEIRALGLEPAVDDLTGRCSMVDAGVMDRIGFLSPPGVAAVCPLGSSADCCTAHPSVGCNSKNIVECVCSQDPSCCTLDWDAACASLGCGDCACTPSACALPHATPMCASGSCAIASCDLGFCDADGAPGNGCENALDDNPTCPGPSFGSVIGDVSGPPLVIGGVLGESRLRVRIVEALTFGSPGTTVRVRLSPPAGSNYDLFVSCLSCTGALKSSTNAGSATEEIQIGRSGLGDSSFDLHVEVRWISGSSCAPWSLEFLGNSGTNDRTCGE